MKKSIIAFLCASMLSTALAPIALADTFVNTTFTGLYKSAGATSTYGATMDINFIDNNNFTVNFSYIKDGRENFVYTFDQGTFNDTKGSVRFRAVRHDGAYSPTGIMTLELREDRILVSCDTDDGVHLFDGDMLLQSATAPSTPAPQPTSAPIQDNTDYQRGTANVIINGTAFKFNAGQEPFIENGHTYVPLRSVFDKMGINVYWADYQYTDQLREQSITCVKNDIIAAFSRSYNNSGSNTWALTKWVNTETSDKNAGTMINTAGMQPIIENGTSYVPLRAISEAFGVEPQWDDANKTVIINCDVSNANKHTADTIKLIEEFSPAMAAQYITADFSGIVLNSYPYYDSESKYYLFDAKDQYGDIYLKISYGGYMTAIPKNQSENQVETGVEAPAEIETPAPTEAPAEPEIPVPTEAPAESETPVPTESPTELETPTLTEEFELGTDDEK